MAAVVRSATDFTNPPNYEFPHHRLALTLRNPEKTPIVLVACGSFSPVTYLHLRMFEMAKDYVRQNTEFEILGGYLSPVSDMYKKPGLLSAEHRVNMCTLGAEDTSTWLMVDSWEAFQDYQRTAVVLDHFDYHINTVLGGARTADGEQRNIRIMLLAGSDLISTMSEPGVWSYADLDHILGRYGTFIVERAGSGMDQATDSLARWRNNIHLISQLIQNDVSSTKVRLFLRRGLSVRYLLPANVVDYIEQNGLYLEDGASPSSNVSEKEKEKESVAGGSKNDSPASSLRS
jgi:nicotinamide mononucleotide adenylyltransferase